MPDELPDVRAFGALFSEFVESMNAAARAVESEVAARMREHLGADPKELPSTSAEFAPTDRPNLQLALDAVLDRSPDSSDAAAALAELLEERSTLTRRLLGQGAEAKTRRRPARRRFPRCCTRSAPRASRFPKPAPGAARLRRAGHRSRAARQLADE